MIGEQRFNLLQPSPKGQSRPAPQARPHDRDHIRASALLGAYALDACDTAEREVVVAHCRVCAMCAADVSRFGEVAGWIGLSAEAAPPRELRSQVLEAAGIESPARIGPPSRNHIGAS